MLVLDGAMDTVVATVLVICVPIVGVGAAPDSGAACGVTAANSGPENLNLEAVSFPSRPSFSMPLSDFFASVLTEKNLLRLLFGADDQASLRQSKYNWLFVDLSCASRHGQRPKGGRR